MRNILCKCFYNNSCLKKDLNSFDDSSIKLFSYNGYKCQVKICNVYDGDTFTGIFQYKNDIIKYKFRCYGYDSPEMKPLKSIPNRDEIKEKANESRLKFIELTNCERSFVIVEFGDFDKYGRILAKVYRKIDNLYVNDEMIKSGHAVEYFGKTKKI
tara:strand:- start:305 stop:772 length:468 start_codon:yes stop_codon:yes gene_type:complete